MDARTSYNRRPLARGPSAGTETPRDALARRRAARLEPGALMRGTEEAR